MAILQSLQSLFRLRTSYIYILKNSKCVHVQKTNQVCTRKLFHANTKGSLQMSLGTIIIAYHYRGSTNLQLIGHANNGVDNTCTTSGTHQTLFVGEDRGWLAIETRAYIPQLSDCIFFRRGPTCTKSVADRNHNASKEMRLHLTVPFHILDPIVTFRFVP